MDNQNYYQNNQMPPYPPYGGQQPNGGVPPSSNLVWAILTTIFCCLPFGIVAIVYASKVDGLWAAGMYDEAYRSARKAGTWSLVAALIWLVICIICGALFFLGILSGLGSLH